MDGTYYVEILPIITDTARQMIFTILSSFRNCLIFQLVIAISPNPKDPIVFLDPWKNKIDPIYPHQKYLIRKKYLISSNSSNDPNDKLISVGFSTFCHILNSETIEYTIRYENKKEATAAAQLITVTDPLSPDLDWGTFELGDMEFSNHRVEVPEGLTYYYTLVDLRPEGNNLLVEIEASFDPLYGDATWTFSAIDPDTGELTEDALAGFLPPNGDNHEGEGFVKFKIQPRAELATGTVIDNKATIVFDWNPPINTPRVFNTIDSGAPTSHVQMLDPN